MTITESLRCPICHSGLTAVANGWRAFSLKPSLGNLGEWLYAGWMYDSRQDAFEEGTVRIRTLGFDPDHYLQMQGRKHEIDDRLTADLRKRYCSLSAKNLAALSGRLGIRYYVFDRSLRDVAPKGWVMVSANAHFLIVRSPVHSS